MNKAVRISYFIMLGLLGLVAWLHVGTLVVTTLFGYFALRKLSFGQHKLLGLGLYLVLVALVCTGFVFFSIKAQKQLPEIARDSIREVSEYLQTKDIEVPTVVELKAWALKEVGEQSASIGRYARETVLQVVMLIIGLVAAASMFLNARWELGDEPGALKDNMYSTVARELVQRFRTFYLSFSKVMGAQIIISGINTMLTATFLMLAGYSYAYLPVLVALVFLCGLIPIIGNIISNCFIVGVGFTISPQTALVALIFLVVIHKLEYFLNSKIIGDRIKNPMWLTLIGLVVGEKLMGIPGMILAPVVLHYLKVEASRQQMNLTRVPFPARSSAAPHPAATTASAPAAEEPAVRA